MLHKTITLVVVTEDYAEYEDTAFGASAAMLELQGKAYQAEKIPQREGGVE